MDENGHYQEKIKSTIFFLPKSVKKEKSENIRRMISPCSNIILLRLDTSIVTLQ